jgi:alkylation response protein AidB-like acyl-CoA dehydrogenase
MNFDFTDEQLMLRQMTRELLARESATGGAAAVRRLMEQPEGYSEETWRQLAEVGLLGLPFPEAYGGQGLGMVELALVLEEMGRAAYPGPYFASVVLAGTAIMAGGSDEQKRRYLTGIAAGRTKASLALLEDGVGWGPDAVGLAARQVAERGRPGYVLNGTKQLVPYAHVAGLLIVAARTAPAGDGQDAERGITLFAVDRGTPGVDVRPQATIDLTNRVSEVTFRDVSVDGDRAIGAVGGGWPILESVLEHAAVGASAEMLGAARTALAMSVDYAKTREQFGQPIGTFQAIKHKCAEMLLEVEEAHGATYYASWALGAGAPDASLAASVAKAYVSEAARKVCGEAIQVHGGIGFTWEFDLHLYFKRAKHLEPLYGSADFHRERALALTLGAEERDGTAQVHPAPEQAMPARPEPALTA